MIQAIKSNQPLPHAVPGMKSAPAPGSNRIRSKKLQTGPRNITIYRFGPLQREKHTWAQGTFALHENTPRSAGHQSSSSHLHVERTYVQPACDHGARPTHSLTRHLNPT